MIGYHWWRVPHKSGVSYLLRDDFNTAESAPLTSPRSAQPGPGTGTIVDTGDTLDISGGQIVPNAAATGTNNPRITYGALVRSAGLALIWRVKYVVLGINNVAVFGGWSTAAAIIESSTHGFVLKIGGGVEMGFVSGGRVKILDTLAADTYTNIALVLRATGMFVIVDSRLAYVLSNITTTPLYPGINNFGGRYPFGVDYVRAAQLAAPWDTDYGIATQRLAGSQNAGQTFTHEADALVEYGVTTLPSSGNIDVFFRYQDASNYWNVRVNSAGDIELHEVVATVDTTRGSAAAVVVNGDRVLVAFDDETVFVYQSDAFAISYTSAANFKTETVGELDSLGTGGAVDDIISWPRNLSGAAKVKLEAI